MAKATKTLHELQAMLLDEIRRAAGCAGVKNITVQRVTESGAPANWQSHTINYGDAHKDDVNPILHEVLSRLQRQYDAVP